MADRTPLQLTALKPYRCEYCGLPKAQADMYTVASPADKYSHSQCHKCANDFARQDTRHKEHTEVIEVSKSQFVRYRARKLPARAAPHLPTGADEEYRTYRED